MLEVEFQASFCSAEALHKNVTREQVQKILDFVVQNIEPTRYSSLNALYGRLKRAEIGRLHHIELVDFEGINYNDTNGRLIDVYYGVPNEEDSFRLTLEVARYRIDSLGLTEMIQADLHAEKFQERPCSI